MDYLLNHERENNPVGVYTVLNLIINGLPSKLKDFRKMHNPITYVLNLIINGLPSKLKI